MNQNTIAKEISLSIKEGKWLSVVYDSSKEKRDTSFWCFIKDINPKKQILRALAFNDFKGIDVIECNLSFNKIKEAKVINFTTGRYNEELNKKINSNIEEYSWLKYENFSNNILRYLECCSNADSDPFTSNYSMVEGIDVESLKENGEYLLSDSQIHSLVRKVVKLDLEEWEKKQSELAISRLSIDDGDKKYIVAYQKVCFSPEDRKMKIIGEVKVNPTFLIDGKKHSLSAYTELSAIEFKGLLKTDFDNAVEIIRENLYYREKINTRPDFFCLQRDVQINLNPLFDKIEDKWAKGELNVPLKAFFGNSSLSNNGRSLPGIVLFDDRVNSDQALLIYNSLKNKITYVQGPPGTGKTQTIFNTILSAYFADKSVLVSTNNNRPLEGIISKIDFKYQGKKIDFPYLRLGNSAKVQESLLRMKEMLDIDLDDAISNTELDKLKTKLLASNKEAVLSLTNFQRRKTVIENLSFLDRVSSFGAKTSIVKRQREKLEEELNALPDISEDELISSFVSLKNDEDAMKYLYYSSLNRLKRLRTHRYEELLDIINCSDEAKRRMRFNSFISEDKNMELLTNVFPIIFTTNISSARLGSGDFLFDLIIMDEAGQADIAHSLLPLSRGKALLLVGDEDQLTPVVNIDDKTNEDLKEKFEISDGYDYLTNSILSTMKEADKVSNRVLLRDHYRCGKKIINFSNKYFYQNKLRLQKDLISGDVECYKTINYVKTPLRNQNYQEAANVVEYCKKANLDNCAIITPFINQANLINSLLERSGVTGVKASTIHSVQGDEKETIIVSTGISKYSSKGALSWLHNHGEIANVAVSRAKKKLVVFSDKEALKKIDTGDDVWNELVSYCDSNGSCEVVPPNYSNLAIGKSNGSLSEDEFYETIKQIVSTKRKLKVVRNVPLKDVFGEEYANSLQEFDSVIYERGALGAFKAKYAFEFDGGEHFSDAKRIKSDKKKMEICQSKGLQLIRLPNSYSKDYEFLKKLIEGYKNIDEMEQLSLF